MNFPKTTERTRSYVSPTIAQVSLDLQSLLAYSNTERINEDDTQYPWDNN